MARKEEGYKQLTQFAKNLIDNWLGSLAKSITVDMAENNCEMFGRVKSRGVTRTAKHPKLP